MTWLLKALSLNLKLPASIMILLESIRKFLELVLEGFKGKLKLLMSHIDDIA